MTFHSEESTTQYGGATMTSHVLSVDELVRRAWRFGVGAWTLSPFLTLLGEGRVAGDPTALATAWAVEKGHLTFQDGAGCRTLEFDQAITRLDGKVVLTARHGDGQLFTLEEVDGAGSLASDSSLHLIRRSRGPKRRNLVVIRAGTAALHAKWVRDLAEEDRSWDLCVSAYGNGEVNIADPVPEYFVEQRDDRKFGALYKLMHQGSDLWEYEFFAFPDDDLMMSYKDVNSIFEVCRAHNLQVATPAQRGGYVSYREMHQRSEFILRYVSLIECLMPIFSREALRRCAPTFALQVNGYGVNFAWTKLLTGPPERMAIIDKVGILHTRPIATTYDMAAELRSGAEVARRFGKGDPFAMRELGGVYAEPVAR